MNAIILRFAWSWLAECLAQVSPHLTRQAVYTRGPPRPYTVEARQAIYTRHPPRPYTLEARQAISFGWLFGLKSASRQVSSHLTDSRATTKNGLRRRQAGKRLIEALEAVVIARTDMTF